MSYYFVTLLFRMLDLNWREFYCNIIISWLGQHYNSFDWETLHWPGLCPFTLCRFFTMLAKQENIGVQSHTMNSRTCNCLAGVINHLSLLACTFRNDCVTVWQSYLCKRCIVCYGKSVRLSVCPLHSGIMSCRGMRSSLSGRPVSPVSWGQEWLMGDDPLQIKFDCKEVDPCENSRTVHISSHTPKP